MEWCAYGVLVRNIKRPITKTGNRIYGMEWNMERTQNQWIGERNISHNMKHIHACAEVGNRHREHSWNRNTMCSNCTPLVNT